MLCITLFCVFSIIGFILFAYDYLPFNQVDDDDIQEKTDNKQEETKKEDNKNEDEPKKDDNTHNVSDTVEELLVKKIRDNRLDALYNEDSRVSYSKDNVPNGSLYMAYLTTEDNNSSTKAKMDNNFKNVYGFIPDNYKDILCQVENEVLVNYNKETGEFKYNTTHPGHGYYGPGFIDYSVVELTNDGNKYAITLLLMNSNNVEGMKVNGDNIDVDNIDLDNETETKTYFKNHLDDFGNVPKFKYTFEKVDNDYFLKEFTILKQV